MISKNKKRKILVPKSANLRKCTVQLGQIDNLVNSAKRKTYGKQRIGTPAPPGTKLTRVKNEIFKKTSTPVGNNERLSKRTPKPNRRYVNEETVNTSTWNEKETSSNPTSDEEEEEDRPQRSPQTEPTRKSRSRIAAPKTVGGTVNKEVDRLAIKKRKIANDERPAPRQHKKVSVEFIVLYCVCLYTDNDATVRNNKSLRCFFFEFLFVTRVNREGLQLGINLIQIFIQQVKKFGYRENGENASGKIVR